MAKPLTNLLKKDIPFAWREKEEESFQEFKEKLCTKPVLIFPDFSKPFIVTTDASGYAIGGILSQGVINNDRPVAYASRTRNGPELRYDTYEKEALAIVYNIINPIYMEENSLWSQIISLWFGFEHARMVTLEYYDGD